DRVGLEDSQLKRLENLEKRGMPNRARLLSSLEKLLEFGVRVEGVQLDSRHARPSVLPHVAEIQTPFSSRGRPCTRIGVMSSWVMSLLGRACRGLSPRKRDCARLSRRRVPC